MKLLSIGAAALTLSGFAVASETDYSSFDRDIEALVSGQMDNAGPHISGYMQINYSNSGDEVFSGAPGVDLGGFTVPRARLSFTGEHNDYGYKLQLDTAKTNILLDAYVDVPVNNFGVRAGLFKAGISRNGLNSSSKLFFINRSQIGDLFDNRDAGAMLSGSMDQLNWALTVQNGGDGVADELRIAGRVAFDFMGNGIGKVEGAYGGPDEMSGTVALAMYDDGTFNDGTGTLVEAHVVSSQYSFGAEILDTDIDGVSAAPGTSLLSGDTTAFSVYGTYMMTPDQWEVGVRFQDMDDAASTSALEVGVNRYLDGHDLKYSFGYMTISSDD
ncbi:MAG: porin, partial [Planctomycetota bacterium]